MTSIFNRSFKTLFESAEATHFGRKSVLALLTFQLGSVLIELLGFFSLIPILQYLQNDGDVAGLLTKHDHWRALRDFYGMVGLPLRLELLLVSSFVLLVLRQSFVFARLRYMAYVQTRAIAQMRLEIFLAFIGARTDAQEKHATGVIVNDMTTELNRAASYLVALVTLYGSAILFVFYMCAMLFLSPSMTVAALLVFGSAVLLLRTQMVKSGKIGQLVTDSNQRMSSFLVERLQQVRLIRLAGMENAEVEAMSHLVERQREAMKNVHYLLSNIEVIMEPVVVAAGFTFLYVAVAVLHLPLSHIALFLLILMRLMPVVKEASRTRQSCLAQMPSFSAVVESKNEYEQAAELKGGDMTFKGVQGAIRFEDVTFCYPGSVAPSLSGVNLEFPVGTATALVGPSGAGKSTLIDMLPRIRIPQEGQIIVGDTPIMAFDLESLRSGIAYAPQTPQIFNVPLSEHIRYGKPGASMAEVERAAELACIAEFISSLPEGYETMTGEGGERLSGGQRQRLDLARALVAQTPILLLDEPTSNLDARSEELFRDAMVRIRSETDITIILIGHQLSSIMTADQIVVMGDGRIVEIGRHESLMKSDGWYAHAFKTQRNAAMPAEQET